MNDSRPPTWKLYERLIASIEADQLSAETIIIPNAKLIGCISGVERQIDVLIDARLEEDVTKRIIIDAKLYKRKINVKDVESFEGMMKDCRAQRGVLVCPKGYSKAALRRAQKAIQIKLVTFEELEDLSFAQWDLCLGVCSSADSKYKERGWVLWDSPLGLGSLTSPISITAVGKCDVCGDFNLWCWDCGQRFAMSGDEAEFKCDCDRFWITSLESEGQDTHGNELRSIVLTVVLLNPQELYFSVDRRPLN